MPALKLFGRKWLTATDDLVYPGLFEILIHLIWLILIGIGCVKYYSSTWKCQLGGDLVRVYLLGQVTILGIVMILTFFIIRYSSRGSITNTYARRYVEPLLTVKIFMILPEISWNILGTLWIFNKDIIECEIEQYTISVVKTIVFFNWILIGLTIFGFVLVFDPVGSLNMRKNNLDDSIEHTKISRIWRRRFKFFWWMRKDESANETFENVAGLLTEIFRGTDLVPSDVMAGLILLRVRQKRETHILNTLNLSKPKYTVDVREIFINTPSWMTLENAYHFLELSLAFYGWLYVFYKHPCTGCFRIIPNLTCCGCFRKKRKVILDDNCCFCNLSGVKYMSTLSDDDILFATFKNHLCEIPFCVIADHKTSSIVIIIRGSLSLRDLFTDTAATSEPFECSGLPPGSMAHKGMIIGAKVILRQLNHHKILERAFNTYPTYTLTLTGHSLGAGIAVLLAILLRQQYPNLRVYAFSTPAGLLSRAAAKVTEEFVLTIGLGDDFVMRLSVNSVEDLRTSLLETLAACRLPKYRVFLNGFGYALHGIPERDLEKTWENSDIVHPLPIQSPLLTRLTNTNNVENKVLARNISQRRYSKIRLYNAGLILHLSRCKSTETDTKSKKKEKEKKFEMRWAQPEEFTKLIVMPRMMFDHFPDYLEDALATLVKQQKDLSIYFDS